MRLHSHKKILLFIMGFILILNLSQCVRQCNDQVNYGYIRTTWNRVEMTVCMLRTEIIQNCQLYHSLIQTQAYDLVNFQQVQCSTKPANTFLAQLTQNGFAYVPYSQRINYCLKYRGNDNSLTTFTCGECDYLNRLNGLNRCTQKVLGCITYEKYGSCIECNQQYQLIGNSCTPRILKSHDANCQISNRQGNCIRCKQSFILAGDLCYDSIEKKKTIDLLLGECKLGQIRLPLGKCVRQMKHCVKYDEDNGLCLYCQDGYRFNDQLTECIVYGELNADILCPKLQSSSTKYKVINGKCVQVDKYCVDNPPLQTGCVNCESGYFAWGGRCYFINQLENSN